MSKTARKMPRGSMVYVRETAANAVERISAGRTFSDSLLGLAERHDALLERVTVLERALEDIAKISEGMHPLPRTMGQIAREALDA